MIPVILEAFKIYFLLQDGVAALVSDLNHPAIKRSKNVESFLSRCK